MKRQSCLRRLAVGALACGLAAGCSHNHSPEAVTVAPTPPPMVSAAEVVPVGAVVTELPPQPAPAAAVARPAGPPAVQQVTYTTPAAPSKPRADGPALTPPGAREQKPSFPRGEPAAPKRAVVDITAASSFGHAPDYTWLSGQVEYSRLANGWRLRYASVDESDAHGGSVTLAGDNRLSQLKDGQHVRVRGHLQNPEDKELAPAYHVDSFEVIAPSK